MDRVVASAVVYSRSNSIRSDIALLAPIFLSALFSLSLSLSLFLQNGGDPGGSSVVLQSTETMEATTTLAVSTTPTPPPRGNDVRIDIESLSPIVQPHPLFTNSLACLPTGLTGFTRMETLTRVLEQARTHISSLLSLSLLPRVSCARGRAGTKRRFAPRISSSRTNWRRGQKSSEIRERGYEQNW